MNFAYYTTGAGNLSTEDFKKRLNRMYCEYLNGADPLPDTGGLLFCESIGHLHYSIVQHSAFRSPDYCHLESWSVFIQDLNKPAGVPDNQWEGILIAEECCDSLQEAKNLIMAESLKRIAEQTTEAFSKLGDLK